MNFLGTIDWVFLILYMLVIAGISIWSIRKSKNSPPIIFWRTVISAGGLSALRSLHQT